ncbi:hypothetical protein ALC60_01963, partial [Trachymyrmex zeteki]
FIDCPVEWIREVHIIGDKYMQYDRKRSSSREGCELKDSTLRGKERERIHRITNELRDSIKHLLDALLRGGRAKQGVRKK